MKQKQIPLKLFGKDSVINEKLPSYTDSYLKKLTNQYPVAEILGDKLKEIKQGKGLDSITIGSPAQNSEAEHILNEILFLSANNGNWVGRFYDVTNAKQYLDLLKTNPEARGFFQHDSELDRKVGLYKARESGLVLLAAEHKFLIAAPTQKFIEYCAKKTMEERK